jgi:hypothetical protein
MPVESMLSIVIFALSVGLGGLGFLLFYALRPY